MNKIFKKIGRNNFIKFCLFKLFNPHLHFANEAPKDWCLYLNTSKPFLNYKTNRFESFINESFNVNPSEPEEEYLIHYKKDCVIEPNIGWALNSNELVIQFSLPYGGSGIRPLPHYIYYKRRKYIDIESGVSIRYNWFNYWHFYSDVIGQLLLLEKLKFDKSIPLIMPAKALELEYVRSFLKTPYAKTWNWLYQDRDTYVRLKSVFFCKCVPNIKDQFVFANSILHISYQFQPGVQRLYVKRNKSKGRFISNDIEIEQLLLFYNFIIVDAETINLEQQIELFSNAAFVVGVHGAGLTNILYRYPQHCKLLEIFPLNHAPAHYYWLCRELGFAYDAVAGDELMEGGFHLDKDKLELVLRKNLQFFDKEKSVGYN